MSRTLEAEREKMVAAIRRDSVPLFSLGEVKMMPSVQEDFTKSEIELAIAMHERCLSCDCYDEKEYRENLWLLKNNEDILTSYTNKVGKKVILLTRKDRKLTVVFAKNELQR